MKRILYVSALLLLAWSCQYETLPKAGEPAVSFEGESITTYPGETVTVTGTASDPAGIGLIELSCSLGSYTREIDLLKAAPSSYGFSADVVIPESTSPGTYEFTASVRSSVSGTADGTFSIIVAQRPDPVIDTQMPTITMDSPATAAAGEPYAFSLTFADDIGIVECWPKLHITKGWSEYPTVDGEAYDTNGYSITVSGTETTVEYTLVFPSGGTYDVIVYDSENGVTDGTNTIERADDWSIAKFTIEVEYPESEDKDAPVITMNSAATAVLGEPYTLSLTVTDEGGMPQAWPKVTVACGDVMPQELVDNWNGWWPEVGGTSVTVEQALTFTQAGEYMVHIEPILDNAGNATEDKDWFTITVTEGVVAPTYLTLEELPTSLSLKLEGGLATYTLYMKGERTDGNNYTGVEFDLYDTAWNKLVPYGCTNTWDWGEWGMYGTPAYQLDKVISFDTAGSYYLYIGEKWDGDGYAGHQIDITVQ